MGEETKGLAVATLAGTETVSGPGLVVVFEVGPGCGSAILGGGDAGTGAGVGAGVGAGGVAVAGAGSGTGSAITDVVWVGLRVKSTVGGGSSVGLNRLVFARIASTSTSTGSALRLYAGSSSRGVSSSCGISRPAAERKICLRIRSSSARRTCMRVVDWYT